MSNYVKLFYDSKHSQTYRITRKEINLNTICELLDFVSGTKTFTTLNHFTYYMFSMILILLTLFLRYAHLVN